jgi:hypothetical protein
MRHPLEFIPKNLRKPLFYVFFILTLLIFGIFRGLDQPLRTAAAPSGIVSFELAQEPVTAQSIIISWDPNARLFAAFGLGLDYLFMPAYALALSLGILLMMNGRTGWVLQLSAWMGWGIFAAAVLDAVENYALLKELTGAVISPYPEIAALCAAIKFALLVVGLLTVIIGRIIKKEQTWKRTLFHPSRFILHPCSSPPTPQTSTVRSSFVVPRLPTYPAAKSRETDCRGS